MTLPHDRQVAAWLADDASEAPPESLARALAATRRIRKRPRWTFPERWLPMQMTVARMPSSRPILIVVVVAALVLALTATALFVGSRPAPVPAPFGPARNGALVYADAGDLLIADTVGGTTRTLVGGTAEDTYPVFSPQGDSIAFLRADPDGGVRLMRVRPDGSDVRELGGPFPTINGVRWSPDGSELLVEFARGGISRLALVAADGLSTLELPIGIPADVASWRPDGSAVAYRGQPGLGAAVAAVYLYGTDGGNDQLDGLTSERSVSDFWGLSWSPDGTRLSFVREADLGGFLGWQIGIADIDAAGAVRAIHDRRFDPESAAEMLPVWSPDGSRLAFILEKHGSRRIAIADADGTGPARAVGPVVPAASGMGHAWSPDGRTLLVSELPRSGPQRFWSVDAASGAATEVTGPTTDLPTWQRLAP